MKMLRWSTFICMFMTVVLFSCSSVNGSSAGKIKLVPIASNFTEVTDLQFVPGLQNLLAITEKSGNLWWYDIKTKKRGKWKWIDVESSWEQGLLGLAFHPLFEKNGHFYINYSTKTNGKNVSRIESWVFPPGKNPRQLIPIAKSVVLEVEQPYGNHNAGQLAFGPDGYLYIGFGDGGDGGDPHGHGQNTTTWLGSILRIDVDNPAKGNNYGIPKDNPFINNPDYLPEIWAFGFRNPWRYSFDRQGHLIVADVGQGSWEEINIVEKGKNYGWNTREGRHCYSPAKGCSNATLVDPIHEYSHSIGQSITGGYVYFGKKLTKLSGKYVFADFVQGKIWAAEIPAAGRDITNVTLLGKWPIQIATFGRTGDGELYVSDYNKGTIYRMEPL